MSLRLRHLISLFAVAGCVGDAPPDSATPDAAAAGEAAAPAAPSSDVIAGELIVRLDQPLAIGVAVDLGGHRVVPVMEIMQGTWLVRLDVTAMRAAMPLPEFTMTAIADVARVPGVRYTHPNHLLEWSATPNDAYVSAQLWHYDQIRLREAWNLTTGPVNSSDVSIAVIDSGSTAHPDIDWASGANFAVTPADDNTVNPFTYHHGVTVAGLIAARGNNGVGVAGVCWRCSIIPIRVNPAVYSVSTAAVASGLLWAAGLNDLSGPTFPVPRRAQVANLSFNRDDPSSTCDTDITLRDAIAAAVARGVSVVSSAGNGQRSTGPTFPANCPGVIAVAASTQSDSLAVYSNRGLGIDVVAPGGSFGPNDGYGVDVPAGSCPQYQNEPFPYSGSGGIVSTWSTTSFGFAQAPADHCYRQGAGTSFAAPHVAGVAALMRSVRPNLSAAQTKAVIRLTASRPQSVLGAGFVCATGTCGAGRLDAYAAVDAINDGDPAIAETAPNFHDFGTVTGVQIRTVTLSNIGFGDTLARTAPMQLVGGTWFHFTDGCSGQSCDQPYAFGRGGSMDTRIVCEPTGPGTQTAEFIYNHSGVGQARVQLSCKSNAVGVLTTPSTLPFGNVPVATANFQSLVLTNAGPNALAITSHTLSGTGFSLVSPLPPTISAFSSAIVFVQCTPPAATLYTGTFVINSSGGNRSVALSCTGAVPMLSVASSVALGAVRVDPDPGVFGEVNVVVSNSGGVPLSVTGAALDVGEMFSWSATLPLSIAPGASGVITVRCKPLTEGLHEDTLQLDSNAGPAYVPLSCTGVVPRLSVSPSTVYFGFVAVGTPVTRTVTIRNTGSGTLTVTHVFASGGAFSVPTLGAVLTPGASRTVTARCIPFTTGNLSGYLEVRSDAGDRRINLACIGVEPQLTAPASIDLPDVAVGAASTASLELSNPGELPVTITSATISGSGSASLSVLNVPSTIPAGESAMVVVRCAPSAVGPIAGSLQISFEGMAAPTTVELHCVAVEAGGGEVEIPIDLDPIGPIWPPTDETM